MSEARHRVVVVGGGFGGIRAARALARADADITIVDRTNHHLFQPLLYQVATGILPDGLIAPALRSVVRKQANARVVLADVQDLDLDGRVVHALAPDGRKLTLRYDSLVVAAGCTDAYFGHDEWPVFAPGLKTLEDATTIRRRVLTAFEEAECEPDPEKRAALLTFAIVGAGPTGVELAGTIAELAHRTLSPDFRRVDTRKARVVLIEAGPRVLPGFHESLSDYAAQALDRLGVTVELNKPVTDCSAKGVVFSGELLPAKTVIWAAGVGASPAAQWLGAPCDRAGRIKVNPDLTVPGYPDIFAVGDTVTIADKRGSPVPGIAPAAKQQGSYVAKTIRRKLNGASKPRPFHYGNAGSLANVGRGAAVVDFGWIRLKGMLAWWIWGIAHIYFLIGLRNRLSVILSWLWVYIHDQRGARLITQGMDAEEKKPADRADAQECAAR